MFDPDRLVVSPAAIDHDPALPGHAVQEPGEVWQIGKVLRLVDDEDHVVEALHVQRVGCGRFFRTLFAEDGDLVAERLPDLDVLRDRAHGTRKAIQLRDQQELHAGPPLHRIDAAGGRDKLGGDEQQLHPATPSRAGAIAPAATLRTLMTSPNAGAGRPAHRLIKAHGEGHPRLPPQDGP